VTAPATPTIQQQAKLGIAKKIAERSERGQKLFQTQKHLINQINADTYSVPSCSTDEHYTVHYGERVEDCTCIDFGMNRGEIACKHLAAVAIMHAARRSGVREIRLLAAAAGDPFSFAGKMGSEACSGCGRRFSQRDLTELTEDNHDNLTYFHGDRLCPACADNASVEH
jgi:hypothetical protein